MLNYNTLQHSFWAKNGCAECCHLAYCHLSFVIVILAPHLPQNGGLVKPELCYEVVKAMQLCYQSYAMSRSKMVFDWHRDNR